MQEAADYTLRIGLIEVRTQHIISTTTYNGQFPGPSPAVQGRAADVFITEQSRVSKTDG
jgi:hypothetical protein